MADRGWTDMFGALREREFDRLLTGQVVAATGEAMIPVALSFAVLDMTDSPTAVGIVLAAGVVPVVLFVLFGGVWADRLPRQRVMMGADLVRAGLQAVLALLLLSGRASLGEIVVLQAARGTAQAFFRPAITGLVPQTLASARPSRGTRSSTSRRASGRSSAPRSEASSWPEPARAGRSPSEPSPSWSGPPSWRSCARAPSPRVPRGGHSSPSSSPVGARSARAPGCGSSSSSSRSSALRCTVRSWCSDRSSPETSWAGRRRGASSSLPGRRGCSSARSSPCVSDRAVRCASPGWSSWPTSCRLRSSPSERRASRLIGVSQTLWVSAATILVLALIGLSVPSMRNLPSRAAAEETARAAEATRSGEAARSAGPVVRRQRDA